MKRIMAAIGIVLWLAGGVFAANVVEGGHGFIRIVLDASTDFVYNTAVFTTGNHIGLPVKDVYPNGLTLTGIVFKPSAVAATALFNDGSITGPEMPPGFKSITGGIEYFPYWGDKAYKPCIDSSDLVTPTDTVIWFMFLEP